MYTVDVPARNENTISTVLIGKIYRYDMVYLHRLAEHDAAAVRAKIELAESAGMRLDEPIAVII